MFLYVLHRRYTDRSLLVADRSLLVAGSGPCIAAVFVQLVQEVSYVKGSQLARESGVFSNDLLGNRGDLGEDAGERECGRPILLRRIEQA